MLLQLNPDWTGVKIQLASKKFSFQKKKCQARKGKVGGEGYSS